MCVCVCADNWVSRNRAVVFFPLGCIFHTLTFVAIREDNDVSYLPIAWFLFYFSIRKNIYKTSMTVKYNVKYKYA